MLFLFLMTVTYTVTVLSEHGNIMLLTAAVHNKSSIKVIAGFLVLKLEKSAK